MIPQAQPVAARSQEEIESEIREQMEDVLENISLLAKHSMTLDKVLTYTIYYLYCQYIITVLELGLTWHIPHTKLYLICVHFQYLIHIISAKQVRGHNLKRLQYFTQLLLVQHTTQGGQIALFTSYLRLRNDYEYSTTFGTFGAVWQVIQDKNHKIILLNKLLVASMWIIGGFQMFLNQNKIDTWFMILQLGLGYTMVGAFALFGTLLCVVLPFVYIYLALKDIHSRRRRQHNFQEINDSAQQYSSLENSNSQPCYICLDEYAPEDMVVYLPCQHLFHRECLKPWLLKNDNCPVCRTLVQ